MLTFFTDESNVQGSDAQEYDLSIYGGLILDEVKFRELTNFLYELKRKYVLKQQIELKWGFHEVWKNMVKVGHIDKNFTAQNQPALYKSSREDYDKLKEEVLDEISRTKAKVIVAVRPNKLLGSSIGQRVEYSIDAVARKFEKVLGREKDFGIILADELRKKLKGEDVIDYEYILELCYNGSGLIHLDRLISIVPTVDSCISPIHQINDILLGAIQYYMLEFIRKLKGKDKNFNLATRLMGKISKNFYRSRGGRYTINSGLLLYPPKNTRQATRAGSFLNKLEKQLETDFEIT
ncbi:MAG: DUF3800 domain-containing protein [Candidatus Sungbacteria bacterium]|nr:DUF3800 domain-containing protein [Candidatus Sungbacteria bacterium]